MSGVACMVPVVHVAKSPVAPSVSRPVGTTHVVVKQRYGVVASVLVADVRIWVWGWIWFVVDVVGLLYILLLLGCGIPV